MDFSMLTPTRILSFVQGLAFAILLACAPNNLSATELDGPEKCRSNGADQERLACYDRVTAYKKPDEAPQASTQYRDVDAADLFVAPRKYLNKEIRVKGVRCYHADERDYRCLGAGGSPLLIQSTHVSPESARQSLEAECGEIKKVFTTSKCRRTVRLKVSDIDSDTISGYQKRVTLGTSLLEIEEPAPRSRRR